MKWLENKAKIYGHTIVPLGMNVFRKNLNLQDTPKNMVIPPKYVKIAHMEHTENTQKEYSYGNKHSLKQVFVEKLRASGLIASACNEAGISHSTYYRWIKTGEKFTQDVNNAMTEAYKDEKLKDELKAIPAHKRSSSLVVCMKAAGDYVDVPKDALPDSNEPVTMFNTDEPITIPHRRAVDINTKIAKSMRKAKMDLLEIFATTVKSITNRDLKALKPEKKAYMIRKISEAITAINL